MKKILIIEDNDEMRNLEKEVLVEAGYEVIEEANAKGGIELAVKEKPDLIIMDIRLPNKKRGIGAAKILRKDPQTKNIPIIFVTAYVLGEDTNEVKSIGNCGYITKPFKIEELLIEISKYLEK